MNRREAHILLVDDDDVDVEAIRRAFKKARILNPMTVARNGVEALEILRGENGREKLPRPYLIFLDLNMPRMNGLEFLDELRADSDLKDSVVFILTTSSQDEDRAAAYHRYSAGYIVKESAGHEFLDLIGLLDHYWKIVELPPE